MDQSVFHHEGPWTEDDFLALTGNDGRVEVVEGTLLVGPAVSARRSGVLARLGEAVRSALPDGLALVGSAPLRLGPDCILIPDFVVTNAAVAPAPFAPGVGRRGVLAAADTLMVIEVFGSDHGAADRTFKPQLYARSRIPYSLLIDHDAPFAVADMIISGRYHEYAAAGRGQRLRLEEPFALELDLDGLTAPGDRSGTTAPAAS